MSFINYLSGLKSARAGMLSSFNLGYKTKTWSAGCGQSFHVERRWGLDDKKRFFESDYLIIWGKVVLLENRFYQLIPL